jgi:dihydrofolate reductase
MDSARTDSVSNAERKVIVRLAASADGFIARPDGNLDWLTQRPKDKGFYGYADFIKTIDTKVIGRKTYDESSKLGAKFDAKNAITVFSRGKPPAHPPSGVEFVSEPVTAFIQRLRAKPGKNVWLMGGGDLIASFLDANAIDEFVIAIVPVFIGEGIPLIAPRHRQVELQLQSVEHFDDGVVQVHYTCRTN